jgi:hypothetical protein
MGLRLTLFTLCLTACTDSSTPRDSAVSPDRALDQLVDHRADVRRRIDGDKAASCASTFGSALTASFGRVDGTILAVVTPWDTWCPLPNSDHLILQVMMNGAAYRMVINVLSTRAGQDPNVRFAEVTSPLVGGPWSEGWHTSVALDYPTTLNADERIFTPYAMKPLVDEVSSHLVLGAKISVFAQSSGGSTAASAHLIHRNGNNVDGAVVIDPTAAQSRYLLFSFADQSF